MTEIYDPAELISIKKIALVLGRASSTVRRQAISGSLAEIEWVDLFGNGRLQATRKSVLSFVKNRQNETAKRLTLRPNKKNK